MASNYLWYPRQETAAAECWFTSIACCNSLHYIMIRDSRITNRGWEMPKQQALKPQDVAVALRLAEIPNASYATLAFDLEISSSTAHESVERLQLAGLLRPDSRQVNRHNLMEFLEHGVRYTFPAKPGAMVRGVPTAYSAPPLASEFVSANNIVWPNVEGSVIGQSLTPLYEKAAELPARCPSAYELLTLVDAIRIGRVRERTAAVGKIRQRLGLAA